MLKRQRWLLALLLLMMLNHALAACDSVVVHLPAEHHNLIGFADDSTHRHQQVPSEHQLHQHASPDQQDGEPHESHAHVLCFVAYHHQPWAEPKAPDAISSAEPAVLKLPLTPPVPPPNV